MYIFSLSYNIWYVCPNQKQERLKTFLPYSFFISLYYHHYIRSINLFERKEMCQLLYSCLLALCLFISFKRGVLYVVTSNYSNAFDYVLNSFETVHLRSDSLEITDSKETLSIIYYACVSYSYLRIGKMECHGKKIKIKCHLY